MKLHETSAFRMALRFAGLFSLIAVIALGSVYIVTVQEFKAQVDRELVHEMDELIQYYNEYGDQSLILHIKNKQRYGRNLHHYYAIADLEYNHLSGNQFLAKIIKQDNLSFQKLVFLDAFEVEHGHGDDEWLRIASQQIDDSYILITAQSSSSIEELQEHTFSAVVIALIVSIFAALATGIYMSKQVLKKISRINSELEASISNNFKSHLAIPTTKDEYQELVLKLNLILHQIERLLTGMRRVTDNIAHDLRSPLTRMRSRLEVTLLQSRSEKEYRHAMQKAVDDSDELLGTFNSLLSIAQAEAGIKGNNWQEINLTSLVDELAELYQLVAEEQQLKFEYEKTDAIIVKGNRQLLAQAISNLLENAIKYTPPGGLVLIKTLEQDNTPSVQVLDSGPGIPDKDKSKVTERFRRLDSARNSPGNGLGLSLVSAVASLHNASLILSDNNPGLCAQIRFPKN